MQFEKSSYPSRRLTILENIWISGVINEKKIQLKLLILLLGSKPWQNLWVMEALLDSDRPSGNYILVLDDICPIIFFQQDSYLSAEFTNDNKQFQITFDILHGQCISIVFEWQLAVFIDKVMVDLLVTLNATYLLLKDVLRTNGYETVVDMVVSGCSHVLQHYDCQINMLINW